MATQNNHIKALQVLHRAFLLGMFVFMCCTVIMVVTRHLKGAAHSTDKILQVVSLLLAAACIASGFKLFNNRIALIPETATITEKLEAYRAPAIIRWATIEAPAIFSLICFIITTNYAFIALSFSIMILFSMLAPNKIKIARDLKLSVAETEALN